MEGALKETEKLGDGRCCQGCEAADPAGIAGCTVVAQAFRRTFQLYLVRLNAGLVLLLKSLLGIYSKGIFLHVS